MSFFDFVFGKKQPEILTDPVFGDLFEHDLKFSTQRFFSGKVIFFPTQKEIEVFISTFGKSLPGEEQRRFYRKIEQDYVFLKEKWRIELENTVQNATGNFKIDALENYFTLISINIPEKFSETAEWQVGFEPIPEIDENYIFSVMMKGWETDGVVIDG